MAVQARAGPIAAATGIGRCDAGDGYRLMLKWACGIACGMLCGPARSLGYGRAVLGITLASIRDNDKRPVPVNGTP